jgi:hypothetical protein
MSSEAQQEVKELLETIIYSLVFLVPVMAFGMVSHDTFLFWRSVFETALVCRFSIAANQLYYLLTGHYVYIGWFIVWRLFLSRIEAIRKILDPSLRTQRREYTHLER